MNPSSSFAQGVRWDLSDLYASPSDPRIEEDLKRGRELALAFEKKYKPAFEKAASNGSSALPLAALLRDYKEILTLLTKPGVYAHLQFAEQTDDAARAAFMQKTQVTLTEIQTHLLFFEVGWNRLSASAVERHLADPDARKDRHFLEKMRSFAPYTLSEPEEKVLSVKADTGGRAFSRLFDETVNRIPFFAVENGKKEQRTEGEILALLHSPDRGVRRMASESLADGLAPATHVLTYIYNMILADHRSSMKLRGLKHPMDSRNLANETDLASIQSLMTAVRGAYPLAQRYYRLKKKLLGLDQLYDYDRYATMETKETQVPFAECRRIVVDAYRAFSPDAGKIVERFFEKRWIDAEIRPGKQGGGFCCETTPDLHPYVLVNYTGSIRDVMVVAHELGHGLHQWLSRAAGILESDAPLTLAETASVFGEMLVFEKIFEAETDKKRKLALLCGKIDDHFATVFRQIAMTVYEDRAHGTGLAEGELSSDKLSDFWIEANRELYGDSVTLTEAYRHGWKYIPHFVHTPFYCYAYAFAQLFVLSLYEKYREEPAGFAERYFEMLSLGGSRKPAEVARTAGLDLQDPAFWKKGLALLERYVERAEELAPPPDRGDREAIRPPSAGRSGGGVAR